MGELDPVEAVRDALTAAGRSRPRLLVTSSARTPAGVAVHAFGVENGSFYVDNGGYVWQMPGGQVSAAGFESQFPDAELREQLFLGGPDSWDRRLR